MPGIVEVALLVLPRQYQLIEDLKMKAKVTYHNQMQAYEYIAINGHEIQHGGGDGNGYCYVHNSFDCKKKLTKEEREAIQNAKRLSCPRCNGS